MNCSWSDMRVGKIDLYVNCLSSSMTLSSSGDHLRANSLREDYYRYCMIGYMYDMLGLVLNLCMPISTLPFEDTKHLYIHTNPLCLYRHRSDERLLPACDLIL
jgi:hypothetical protein